jgi:hypothetical protein
LSKEIVSRLKRRPDKGSGRAMIDLRDTINNLARGFLATNYPEATTIAEALSLDMSHATVATMRSGHVMIRDAALPGALSNVDLVASVGPRAELLVLLHGSGPSYRDIEGETFGEDQKIQKSRLSEGFAVVFRANGLSYALTASSPDSLVEAIFCSARDMSARPAVV